MKRLSSWALPIILAVAGVTLIIVGSLDLDPEPTASLPPIRTPTPIAQASPTPAASLPPDVSPSASEAATPTPSPSPLPDDVVAVQLEVPSVGINVLVLEPTATEQCSFPPSDGAYLLCRTDADGSLLPAYQPGRGTNTYVFAHAVLPLFKPLWNVQVGAEVLVRMSDESILRYVVTEVRPNVACPDPGATTDNPPNPPLALQIHDDCSEGVFWTQPTDHERLTLQTSQGYNRNWGELVVIALPAS